METRLLTIDLDDTVFRRFIGISSSSSRIMPYSCCCLFTDNLTIVFRSIKLEEALCQASSLLNSSMKKLNENYPQETRLGNKYSVVPQDGIEWGSCDEFNL
jgi:hypothetical protein